MGRESRTASSPLLQANHSGTQSAQSTTPDLVRLLRRARSSSESQSSIATTERPRVVHDNSDNPTRQDRAMRDWKQFVRENLPPLSLGPERESEIANEMAQHLESVYEDALADGATEEDAFRRASAQIKDWHHLE